MGTRRSRHNKGRKPLYKEHRENLVLLDAELPPIDRHLADDNSFLFSENTKRLTLEAAQSLTQEDAYTAFKAIRWPDGKPVCVECGNTHVYERQARRNFKCAACETDFSTTSRTVFASYKMPFTRILVALAVTVGANPAKNVSEASRAIGITSKGAFMLLRRLREAAKLPEIPETRPFEIGRPRYYNGLHLSTRCWWTEPEKVALAQFIDDGYKPNVVADALGRKPTSLAHYARDKGLYLPSEWSKLIMPNGSGPRVTLAYPYIARKRPEHTDLLALNDLVPHSYPDQTRADICQEMMLAVLEGRTTVEEIKSKRGESAWFLKKFWMANYEDGGRAVSLTAMPDDDRSYDEVAASAAAKEWWSGEVAERQRFFNQFPTLQPPTQIEDTWRRQIQRARSHVAALGHFMEFDDAADMVESGEYRTAYPKQRSHGLQRAEQRYGVRLDRGAIRSIKERIQNGEATFCGQQNENVIYVSVAYGGRALPIIYDRSTGTIITVLPEPHKENYEKSHGITAWSAT